MLQKLMKNPCSFLFKQSVYYCCYNGQKIWLCKTLFNSLTEYTELHHAQQERSNTGLVLCDLSPLHQF